MHPRLTVFCAAFGGEPIGDVFASCRRAGIGRIGLRAEMVSASEGLAGRQPDDIEITHVLRSPMFRSLSSLDWSADQQLLSKTIGDAITAGARCIYGTTGRAIEMKWEDAATSFCAAVKPAAETANRAGLPLLIEPTNSLFAGISFVHSLRDTVELAEQADIGVCLDIHHCWSERGLRQTIARAGSRIGLVQISDLMPERRTFFMAVPGDGAIPLERILGWILETGYPGLFDLELTADPAVDPIEALSKGIDHVEALLGRLGVG